MTIGNSFKLGNSLSKSSSEMQSSFEKLSSGKRINKAKDDAAGLAIVAALESEVRTTIQGARNAVDGISVASIADGALSQISDISSRQAELAAQAANGTLSDEQRSTLNQEFQNLDAEKSRILSTTQFNGVNVFSGTTLQVGSDSSSNSQITIPAVDTASLITGKDISTASGAASALDTLQTQSDTLSGIRGEIGASVNRASISETNSRNKAVESEAAASRIRDVDIADETAKLTSASIRQNATAALSAQIGKINSDTVAKLLS